MRSELYQIALILLGIIATAFFGVFFYREIFPEYRIYQNDYIALEKFRSTYTGEPSPAFQMGVKQIVFEREDKGPPEIDRCTSCHVALQFPHFSPTKIETDINGNIVHDVSGTPVKVQNENYIWAKLDKKIADLTDVKVIQQLKEEREFSKIEARLKEAEELKSLKTAKVGDHLYDVAKVLAMHPLIGKETRPFEFHSLDEYGCTSCHGGNGRGLTTNKAHGPVFDGEYEIEFMGPKREFLERDEANDPKFAHIFNNKPGDSLLFQTTPILVGSLIQAKCVQCHEKSSSDEQVVSGMVSDVDRLKKDYHHGQQLYISQACYACHRIAGMSRGGVGPELTRAGGLYPWYMKEKIVWPQGTLKTSTMPNMHLDHDEIQDLMTFLLGQKGQSKAVSEIDYKTAIQEWEAGRKMDWEKPIPPSQIYDLRDAMTIFATQGCAACHRLKGYESDIGYRIEKDSAKKPAFDELYREHQWFQNLFPESIRGSAIVHTIEKHADEIDKHIVDNVRIGSLLEEIEEKYPESIEALYSDFRYAFRAKNHLYTEMANSSSDKETKKNALAKLNEWKQRVHRVLMMYVQEYGLGRLIGPRPNWSGVYRSDEWLMEHFHNPAGHVPNSIMPIFPFDDTKFNSLTYMLDKLGKRNRDEVREIWEHKGFDPSQAFHIHCAQCHGDYLQGNGPISEWIYPIPKNLRNAEFLRNLTRENEIHSITHGVKGTPMPPWGETPIDKVNYDGIPVLSREEIVQLVDWIFSSLPGATVIKGSQDVPKWQYSPKDVIDELRKEGGQLKSGSESELPASSSFNPKKHQKLGANQHSIPQELLSLPTGEGYFAALEPTVAVSRKQATHDVEDVFDLVPEPIQEVEKYAYYIKKKYYTQENIEKGKQFFENNCAVCHGKDADGAGIRASIMFDAKPRMLINLDWLKTRDDLRLLRSIKYGVPGTAMTPWGDLTSSLQRLQLVMYIRSLSYDREFRDQLTESLYKAFDRTLNSVESARVDEYKSIEKLEKEVQEIKDKEKMVLDKSQDNAEDFNHAVELYKKQLESTIELKQHRELDSLLLDLKKIIKKESDIYREIGIDLDRAGVSEIDWHRFLKMVDLNENRFALNDGRLTLNATIENEREIASLAKQIAAGLDDKIVKLQKDKVAIQGKIFSEERNAELKDVDAQINTFIKTKQKLLSAVDKISRLHKQEEEIVEQYKEKQNASGIK